MRRYVAALRHRNDEGLTMVELMMSIVIFGIAATAVASGVITAIHATRSDRNRVQASSLAARELEVTRNEFFAGDDGPATLASQPYVVNPHPLPAGTTGQPLQVDGTKYTVERTVQALVAGVGKSPCDGGASVSYPSYQVNVQVTWPQMGTVEPVTSTTILTPSKVTIDNRVGYVAVKVLDSAGAPNPGKVVQLSGPGGTFTSATSSDGCAVFSSNVAGSYTATLAMSGHVDFFGSPTSSKITSIAPNTLSQLTFNYDRKSMFTVSLETEPGYELPASYLTGTPQVTVANTGIQPTGVKSFGLTTAVGGTIDNLWPFADGYAVWAGSCRQSDPSVNGAARPPAVDSTPGGTTTVSVRLAPVDVMVTDASDLPLAGRTVIATPLSTIGCLPPDYQLPTTPTLIVGTTDALGQLKASLPGGAWRLSVQGATSGTSPDTAALSYDSLATSYVVEVWS